MIRVFIDQVLALTEANLKTRYRNTFAGLIWVALYPLMMYGAQAFVFHLILKIQIENYLLFLLSGLLPWIFLTQSIDMNTSMIVNNARLLKSFPIHPFVPVLAQVLDNLINFIVVFTLIFIPISFYTNGFHMQLFLLPIPVLCLLISSAAISFMLSISQVFFYDTRYLVSFVLSFLFYLTPVFYSIEFIPQEYRDYLYLNPFYILISPFQKMMLNHSTSEVLFSLFTALAITVFLVLFSFYFWWRNKQKLYFRL